MNRETEKIKKYWSEHYDNNVDQYGDNHAMILDYRHDRIMEQVYDSIQDIVTPRSNALILDAGCGLGDLSGRILTSSKFQNCNICNIDLSGKVLLKAREYLNSRTEKSIDACYFSRMDLMKLGFGDNSFDVVTAVECLQHVDIHITIPEFMRVTRQNGMIAISVPNRKDPIIKKAEIRNNGLFQGVDWLNLREFLNRDERVKCIRIKPLIFARDQSEKPYLDAEFKQRLSEEEIEQANRFIIHIEL